MLRHQWLFLQARRTTFLLLIAAVQLAILVLFFWACWWAYWTYFLDPIFELIADHHRATFYAAPTI